jgi:branched-chain amino acid aminotransferase
MEQLVYLNGALLPREEARVSAFDHGFLYGYGLFETMRAYSGCIFRLQEHLDRLARSAAFLGLPVDASDLKAACCETLRANKLGDARVRLTVSMGQGESVPDPPPHPRPTVLVVATGYRPLGGETYLKGYDAILSSIRQNSQSPLSRLKSANYLNCVLARKEARAAGADEALLLNERGFLCEGSTSNIFLVTGDSLVTPDEQSGCLPGITRQAVLELARELGIGVAQREISLEELRQADEAFITNSLLELMPLAGLDGRPIPGEEREGESRRITGTLMKAYGELVARETNPCP